MQIIRHNRECVTFHTLNSFLKILKKFYKTDDIRYDEDNRGIIVKGDCFKWSKVASDLEWFDDAEIVTDKNENERVMTWLNV